MSVFTVAVCGFAYTTLQVTRALAVYHITVVKARGSGRKRVYGVVRLRLHGMRQSISHSKINERQSRVKVKVNLDLYSALS